MSTAVRTAYTVSELNDAVEAMFKSTFPQSVWVRGEVADRREGVNGHLFFTLVEAEKGRVKARLPCVFWASDVQRFLTRLKEQNLQNFLQENVEVCLAGQVRYYVRDGRVSLHVREVDIYYTLGKLAKKKEELRALLIQRGLYDRNRALPVSPMPLRVGLVTGKESAAELDFLRELEQSGLAFSVCIANALVQGREAEQEVVGALKRLEALDLDLICLTRGGGGFSDLAVFDSWAIAEAIATSRLPVVTGIGHEKDVSLADEVACVRCKTPTKAAQYLVERVRESIAALELSGLEIARKAERKLQGERGLMDRHALGMAAKAHRVLQRESAHFHEQGVFLVTMGKSLLQRGEELLKSPSRELQREARHQLQRRRRDIAESEKGLTREILFPRLRLPLEMAEAELAGTLRQLQLFLERQKEGLLASQARAAGFDLRRVLERGFALVKQEEKTVKRKCELNWAEPLWLTFYDGDVHLSLKEVP